MLDTVNRVRLLITGSSGFVGTHLQSVIAALPETFANVELLFYGRDLHLDLFDESAPLQIIEDLKPTHVLHLAWASTSVKNYDLSEENFRWMDLTCSLVEQFSAEGIVNWVVGTGLENSNSHEMVQSAYGKAKSGTKNKILGMKSENARWISMPYLFSLYHARPRIMSTLDRGDDLKHPLDQHDYLEIRDCVFQIGKKIMSDHSRHLLISRGQMHSNQMLVDRAKAVQGSEVAMTCSCMSNATNSENMSPFYFTDKVLYS